jgi:hypothetical protein
MASADLANTESMLQQNSFRRSFGEARGMKIREIMNQNVEREVAGETVGKIADAA